MILVVGLGNPGPRYVETRHNAGFMVVERLVQAAGGGPFRSAFEGRIAPVALGGSRAWALLPETFMNESGRAVGAAARFHRVEPPDVVIVHDELDLPLGDVRLKLGGGDAGHNGLKSVSAHIGTRDYPRVRVGIGRPPANFGGTVADFVLQGVPLADRPQLSQAIDRAVEAVTLIAEQGIARAMNVVNRRL